MKITFDLPQDNETHQYCIECFAEAIERAIVDGQRFDHCTSCGVTLPRSIIISPSITWWIDDQTNEYWHESVGVFMVNAENKILLFERTVYPFSFAIAAGHLDTGEVPETAAKREVEEELGIKLNEITLISEEDLVESCSRGADHHRWHLYAARYSSIDRPIVKEEGRNPIWATREEALAKENLNLPTKHFLEKYGHKILGV